MSLTQWRLLTRLDRDQLFAKGQEQVRQDIWVLTRTLGWELMIINQGYL